MSKNSYITVDSCNIKLLAEQQLQKILDTRAEREYDFVLSYYRNYCRLRRLIPLGHIKSFDEFRTTFKPENSCTRISVSYWRYCKEYQYEHFEKLISILGLCELSPDGQIQISSGDVDALGYPQKCAIPISTEEREYLVAKAELQLLHASN